MRIKIHVGTSPVTGAIYAGKLNSKGNMWVGEKQEVTNEAFDAVAQSILIKDEAMEFTFKGKRYLLQVIELK